MTYGPTDGWTDPLTETITRRLTMTTKMDNNDEVDNSDELNEGTMSKSSSVCACVCAPV